MRSPSSLATLCVQALAESVDPRTMVHVAKDLMPNYDVHASTGYPESMVIPTREIAERIVADIMAEDSPFRPH